MNKSKKNKQKKKLRNEHKKQIYAHSEAHTHKQAKSIKNQSLKT